MADFSEKDAARSKWKLSRKHQPRGRGRGRVSTASRRHVEDLGSNWDRSVAAPLPPLLFCILPHLNSTLSHRYEDEVDENQLAEGPVRRSQGADLAEWASQHPPQDPLFFARQRVNLNQDVGLPPAEPDAFQGLSFDLQGLADCLRALPLGDVLKFPPGLVGEERDGGGDGSRLESDCVDRKSAAAALEKREEAKPAAAAAAVPPPPAAPSLPKPAPAPPKHAPAAHPPPAEDEDAELEALLGLGPAAAAPTAAAAAKRPSAPSGQGDSLEAWLDTL
jgi:hypothetical protein